MDQYFKQNKELWDNWAQIHAESEYYDVASFKAGKSSLNTLVREEVGDVEGKSLLHLQCHFGKDTLSWARLGAKVTGADFSEKAIEIARGLAADVGIEADFVCCNLYDLPNVLKGEFDIVFTSYGAIYWLPDMKAWGEVIAHFLKPGGTFYIAEFHPFVMVFDNDLPETDLRLEYSYFQRPEEPLRFETHGTYADRTADYHSVEYGWNHTMGEIINSLIDAGLRIEFLHEFPFSVEQTFQGMVRGEDGWFRLKEKDGVLPLMFSLRATKI